jgi:hypothetical protein
MPPGGSCQAGFRTAERAAFMLDDYAAMSSYGQLLTEKFPNSQETYYLKKAQHGNGS